MAQESVLNIRLGGIDVAKTKVQEFSEKIAENKAEQKKLLQQINEINKATAGNKKLTDEQIETRGKLTAELQKNRTETTKLTRDMKANQKMADSMDGSLDQLSGLLTELTSQYRGLSQAEREGAQGQELLTHIKQTSDELKGLEKAMGDNRRNVGNYGEAVGMLSPKLAGFAQAFTGMQEKLEGFTESFKVSGSTAQAGGSMLTGAFNSIKTSIMGATRAAIAFIATPIGAAIAALAAIVGITKKFMDYNAEVEKSNALIMGITNQTGAVVDDIRIKTQAMSDVLGITQEELTNKAKVLVEQFGITYEEALSKMETGILATNGANEEFMQSIGEYSTFFAQAGYSVEEFANIVNAGFDLGMYTDKLPDAIKEADISLREMTKGTRDALVNAFGDDFTNEIASKINSGAITTKEALELIAEESKHVVQANGEIGLSSQQAAQLTADVFRGAGEDAGGALAIFEAVNVSLEEGTSQLDEQGKRLQENIAREQEVAEARDKAMNSESVRAFMKVLKDTGAFLKKVFFVTIEAFAMTVDYSLIKPIEFVVDGFKKLIDVSKKALSPLKSIASALGMSSKETEKASESTGDFINKLKQQAQQAEQSARAQENANAQTERAALVLQEAKERAQEYVETLRDIALEQERQPLLMEAEDMMSEQTAEEITGMLNHVAEQIEENANITVVSYRGMRLSVEEFADLTQSRLNDIAQQEEKDASDREKRSSDRAKQIEKELQDELKRIEKIQELGRTEREELKFKLDQQLTDLKIYFDESTATAEEIAEFEKTLTEEELLARRQLQHEYNMAIQQMDDEEKQAQLDATEAHLDKMRELYESDVEERQDNLTQLMNEMQVAMNSELMAVEGNEKAKQDIRDKYQKLRLQAEIDATQELIDFVTEQLQSDLDQEALGLDLFSDEQTAEMKANLQELIVQMSDLKTQYSEINYVDETPKSIGEMLGMDEEGIATAQLAFETFTQGMEVVSQALAQQTQNQMLEIGAQRKEGLISEEEFQNKRQAIEQKAALQTHRMRMLNASVSIAKGVMEAYLSTLGQTGIFGLPLAGIAAGIAGAFGAAQLAVMQANKPKFAEGGILKGASHAQGGIQLFGSGGSYYGEAEGGEAILTKGVMQNPKLARMASALNVMGGGVPLFQGGGVLHPIQPASSSEKIGSAISQQINQNQPVLVVEQLRERENTLNVVESLRKVR